MKLQTYNAEDKLEQLNLLTSVWARGWTPTPTYNMNEAPTARTNRLNKLRVASFDELIKQVKVVVKGIHIP